MWGLITQTINTTIFLRGHAFFSHYILAKLLFSHDHLFLLLLPIQKMVYFSGYEQKLVFFLFLGLLYKKLPVTITRVFVLIRFEYNNTVLKSQLFFWTISFLFFFLQRKMLHYL